MKIPIIIISVNDFDDLWTRRQRFAVKLANLGHKVLFMNEMQHIFGVISRRNDLHKRLNPKLVRERKNLFVGNIPYLLPFSNYKIVKKINDLIYSYYLKKYLKKLKISKFYVITYSPVSIDIIRKFNPEKLIWDCVDDWSEYSNYKSSKNVNNNVIDLFKNSNVSFSVSKEIINKYSMYSTNIHLLPNGVDLNFFENSYKNVKFIKNTITFIGTIHNWLDFEFIEKVVKENPKYIFKFYGPVSFRVKKNILIIEKYNNIKFYGKIDYKDVPAKLKESEFLWIPFKSNKLLKSVDLIKFYEYILSGRPILTKLYPQIEEFKNNQQIKIYETSKHLSSIINNETNFKYCNNNLIKEFDWDRIFKNFYKKI